MPELIPFLTKEEIASKIAVVAQQISEDYKGRDLVLIGALKGSFIFVSDLARQLTIPAKIDFIRASSYGASTTSSGKVVITQDKTLDIAGKHVLIVEDIVDTGLTLSHLVEYFKAFDAKSVKVCALLDKHERRDKEVTVDYSCHRLEEGFLVGYGLDYNEEYRNLPAIYHLKL